MGKSLLRILRQRQPQAHDVTRVEVSAHDAAHSSECTLFSIGPLYSITCLDGPLTVTRRGQRMETWPSRKAREALAFLATRPGCEATHDELCDAIWPEREPELAQRSLFSAMSSLRAILAAGGDDLARRATPLLAQRHRYMLDRAYCAVDLGDLRQQRLALRPDTDADAWLALAQALGQPVLTGESFGWLPALRHQLRQWCWEALTHVLAQAIASDKTLMAITVAQTMLEMDPLHETTLTLLMRLHLQRGESSQAATCYRAFHRALERQIRMAPEGLNTPSAEAQALYAAACGGEPLPAPDTSPDTS
jgi:DNA-binding SARP family transcriptional activator